MENNSVSRLTIGFGLALALASVLNALLVVVMEKSPAVQAGMKHLTGHHWITHGLADCIVFVGLGLLFMNTSMAAKINPNRLVSILIWAVVAASLGLVAWFLLF